MQKRVIRYVVGGACALLLVVAVFEVTSLTLQSYRLSKVMELHAYCVEKGMNPSLSVDGSNIEFRCVKP